MFQTKKYRDFNREFKVRAVQRMLAGESPSVLARELKVLRKQIYQWKDAYISKGPTALHMRGRPSKNQVPEPPPEATTARAELLQARQHIAELERKVGHQQLEIDFFAEALRRVDAALGVQRRKDDERFTRSSASRPCKAN